MVKSLSLEEMIQIYEIGIMKLNTIIMKNLIKLSVFSVLSIFIISSCNNNIANTKKITAKIDDCKIFLDTDSNQRHNVDISIGELVSFSTSISGREGFNVIDSLKLRKTEHYELAYVLAQSDGLLDVHISIPNKLDTTLQCQFKYSDVGKYQAEIISGKFARIIDTFDSENIDIELRKWVYKNKKINIGDTLFNTMRLYLRELSETSISKYVVMDEIPSFKDAVSYKVTSDIEADYYYLIACNNDSDLDSFIEEVIARNMYRSKKSLDSPLHCITYKEDSGVQCIFLVGINNDWSSQVVPLGVLSLDDIAPSFCEVSNNYKKSYTKIKFPKRGFIIVGKTPKILGACNVTFGDFRGRNPFEIPYTLTWSGDVSKIIIYNSKSSPTTIDLYGKTSPYHITLSTFLPNIGDNYIKLEAVDKLGNKATTDINIATQRVNNNSIVDIDNNIWIP